MTDAAAIGLALAAICIGSLGVMCWLAFTAPRGWEDENGWNAGDHSDFDGDA